MSIYNNEKTLTDAVESIQRQTYKDWDLVVVNDASTDGSKELLLNISKNDPRILILHNVKNAGLAASLNVALSYARGPLIARMDGDDISFPERLKRQVEFFMKHPEVDVLGTNALFMTKSREFTKNIFRKLCTEHKDIVSCLCKQNPFIHPTIMARKDFFVAMGGYNGRYRTSEDLELWFRGHKKFRYHNLQEPLLYYMIDTHLRSDIALIDFLIRLRAGWRERKIFTYGWYAFRSLFKYITKKYFPSYLLGFAKKIDYHIFQTGK